MILSPLAETSACFGATLLVLTLKMEFRMHVCSGLHQGNKAAERQRHVGAVGMSLRHHFQVIEKSFDLIDSHSEDRHVLVTDHNAFCECLGEMLGRVSLCNLCERRRVPMWAVLSLFDGVAAAAHELGECLAT